MADQCTSLTFSYFYQHQGMEELKQTLMFTTVELETTLMSAKQEITRREFELVHLKDVLLRTLKQRDEAQAQCRKLMMEKFVLHQQLQQQQLDTASPFGVSREEDETKPADLSAGEPTIVSSPGSDSISAPVTVPSPLTEHALKLAVNRPLPAKGKLLQAVKDAGPLLQNLLLAGPLPQWQHPPPQLTSIDIPPVAISSNKLKKRGPENYGDDDSSPKTKYQKVVEADLIH
ncbi:Detected protein of unknown function [Hibiscus syriacus]|uniref:Uncharacterized protein n=1 Tax=Hibiscus syriacus TaxID=106335 RepID=A0A6A3BAF4_HIBSY|nr:uncharacterized protein LOC120219057 [Hibiscus syriacus]KAE8713886.1 Detected protein of unknown function [Hibiscus syriacus]